MPSPNIMKMKKYNPVLRHTEEGSAEIKSSFMGDTFKNVNDAL
jgi:hypothetical protein